MAATTTTATSRPQDCDDDGRDDRDGCDDRDACDDRDGRDNWDNDAATTATTTPRRPRQ